MTTDEYRAHPALNYSKAKLLLRSALHYHWVNGRQQQASTEMQMGTMVHAAVLEGKGVPYVIRPDTNEVGDKWHGAKKWCKEWIAAQTLPVVSREEVEDVEGMIDAVANSDDAQQLLSLCPHRETPIVVNYRHTEIKALLDMHGIDAAGNHVIGDLKTCADASPDGFLRSVKAGNYHVQAQWYRNAYALANNLEEPPKWIWLAVENKAPYAVALYVMPDAAEADGQDKMDKCINLYRECVSNNTWPAYGNGIQMLRWY